MHEKLVLGPLLSVENDNKYVVCFLSKTQSNFLIQFNNERIKAEKIGNLKSGYFYRVTYIIEQKNESFKVNYQIINTDYGRIVRDNHKRKNWEFYIPSKEEEIKYAKISCKDISRINLEHQKDPYSLLLTNGEHIDSNKIWSNITELSIWSKLNDKEKIKVITSENLLDKINDFYETEYLRKWNEEEFSLTLATIPNLMMWDDHDIFEGCKSYSKELLNCDICKNIFKTARKYFEIFQLRTIKNATLLTKDRSHFSFVLKFRNQHILELDKFSLYTID